MRQDGWVKAVKQIVPPVLFAIHSGTRTRSLGCGHFGHACASMRSMAFQVLSILRSLAPLIADAGKIVATLRSDNVARTEDRLLKVEQGTIRAGEVLKGVAEQVQVLAQELRTQAELQEHMRRKLQIVLVVSIIALGVGLGSLAFAIFR